MMLRFAICDDEPSMQSSLSALLAREMEGKGPYDVRCFSSGQALLDCPEDFDLLFLDIQMEAPDGMETARQLRRQGKRGLLVFVTILKECVFDAFAVEAFDYLLKPLDPERFQNVLERGLSVLARRREQVLTVQKGTTLQIVPLAEIVYMEVFGRKVSVHQTDGSTLEYYDKLEHLEAHLGGQFFRCHRSFLVNLDHVRRCGGGQVHLADGKAIPLSRLREGAFTQALLRHMAERGRRDV